MLERLGKLFVFLNAIAAVGLLVWAVSLTTSQLDWVTKPEGYKASDELPYADDTNNLERLAAKINTLNEGVKAVQNGLISRSQAVLVAEGNRDLRSAVLNRRLQSARTGFFFFQDTAPGSGLMDVTSREPDPKNPNDAARIIKGLDNKPLEGLDAIQNAVKVSIENQSATSKKVAELLKQYADLTLEIDRLDAEIKRQKEIETNAILESKYLADRTTDWDEQIRTLTKRAKQLDDRLAEVLKAPGSKSTSDKISSNIRP